MANEKMINTRIQLKYDTLTNWEASTFKLKAGELAIVTLANTKDGTTAGTANQHPVLFKVGTGNHTFSELPYASALAADVYSWAKKSGIEVIDEGTGNVVSDIAWDEEKLALVITRIDVYTKEEVDEFIEAIEADIDTINNEETGILAQAKSYVDTEDVFHTDITTVNALGGIGAGANLDGMTTHEILNTLLFPYVAFSITSSSRNAAAATLENGATQTLSSCSITVAKKSKPITSITLKNGSTVLETKTGDAVANGGTITFNGFDAITVSKSNNPNLKFTVTDGQTSTDRNVGASTFVYPYYWGVCAPDATIDEALVEGLTKSVSSKGNKTDIAFTCANQCQVFAYPKAHGVLKSVIDPNNFEIIDSFTRSELNITGLDGTAQAYYVYVSGACSVTDFKIDFKY